MKCLFISSNIALAERSDLAVGILSPVATSSAASSVGEPSFVIMVTGCGGVVRGWRGFREVQPPEGPFDMGLGTRLAFRAPRLPGLLNGTTALGLEGKWCSWAGGG